MEICPNCPLSKRMGGPCGECNAEYQARCLKNYCHSSCDTCGGGRHAKVAACCGRSPLRDKWAEIFNTHLKRYVPEPTSIKCRLIPVIFAQIAKYKIPELFPQIDAWVVPVHKAMNLKGEFRSSDLKDYLGLPKNRKLILSSCGPDNFMEMLWEKGEHLDYQGHSVDYWFPAHFSIYDNDSKFLQFFNARRQIIHAFRVKSQFVWFRLGENIPVEFLDSIQNAPSVLISCQQMYSHFNREILQREAQIADEWFPLHTSFFLIKERTSLPFQAKRTVYEINEHWLIAGLKGHDIHDRPLKNIPIRDVLITNLRAVRNRIISGYPTSQYFSNST